MGGTASYSHDLYASRSASTKAAGTGMFTHDHAVKSGTAKTATHKTLDPLTPNSVGKIVRESFDSDNHPESLAIAVMFDVTGSMSTVPRTFVEKLPKLMAALVKKGYIEHPHVLFGAIGDARFDKSPLQIGQFESGNEMDEAIGNIHLESGGGNNDGESYDLALYYMARHTDLDCVKKRAKKGYLFMLGDEPILTEVSKAQVKRIIGDDLQDDIPLEDILKEVNEKFEVFWILPSGTQGWNRASIQTQYEKLFGERFLKLENPADVCELIVSAIGVTEGYDIHDIASTLKSVGSSKASVDGAITAITPYASSASLTKKNTGAVEGALATTGTTSGTSRL
jgi:hypothetical protein